MTPAVLVVEDEPSLQALLKELLLDNGYNAVTASSGAQALQLIEKNLPDLVILDLGLPDMTGEAVCSEIKKRHPEIPVLILTAKNAVASIVQGLNLGADDYMTKPFDANEFLARVKARLRRGNDLENKIVVADLELNKHTMEVKRSGKAISLTPQELKLLEYLMNNRGRILTREMILNRIWLYSPDIETRVVDVYVGYLRKKVDSGFKKKLLHSVRGFGYMLKE